jgi:23S rRNA pseudouridine1911/1915/1917 synthase
VGQTVNDWLGFWMKGEEREHLTDQDAFHALGDSPNLIFCVAPEEAGLRLDVFLSRRLADRSRSRIKRWIQDGLVKIAGRHLKVSHEIDVGDEVRVWFPSETGLHQLVPYPMPLSILFEDKHLIVVNKAPGVVVHPGAGHHDNTLVHGLLAHAGCLASQGAPLRPGIVHRLDQNTSGAMVVARSDVAYLDLIGQFKDRKVKKEYLAIVYGRFKEQKGEIRTSIDRHATDRKKMAVVTSRGREAVSLWEVEADLGEVSLVRVCIQTGRTHQIRVHFSHIQHPVVGDATYGGGLRRAHSVRSRDLQSILAPVVRQMLHAWKLSFFHPVTRDFLSFEAEPPADFSDLLQRLRNLG